MKNLFKRKSRYSRKQLVDRRDRLIGKAAKYLRQLHARLANWLNRKTAGIPSRQMKIYLFLFCTLFGAASLYVLLSNIL